MPLRCDRAASLNLPENSEGSNLCGGPLVFASFELGIHDLARHTCRAVSGLGLSGAQVRSFRNMGQKEFQCLVVGGLGAAGTGIILAQDPLIAIRPPMNGHSFSRLMAILRG